MCSILLRKKECLVSGVKKAINIYNWQLYLSWQTSWLALFTVSWQEPTLKKRLLKLFCILVHKMILTCQKLRENLDFERMCHWCLLLHHRSLRLEKRKKKRKVLAWKSIPQLTYWCNKLRSHLRKFLTWCHLSFHNLLS